VSGIRWQRPRKARDSGIDPWTDWYVGAIGILELCVLLSIARAVIVAVRIQQLHLHSLTENAGAPNRSPHTFLPPLCGSLFPT
jgi:hypothetical protein